MAGQDDRLLQDVRRIDWRFLLACPALEQVAYIGSPGSNLLAALRLAGASPTVIDPAELDAERGAFDVVVAELAPLDAVLHAASWVGPGGSLYAEFAGGRQGLRAARLLRSQGFARATAYWHWPSLAEATRILPLDDARVLAHSILKERGGWQAWLLRAGVHSLHRARLFGWAVSYSSVVGQR